MPLQPGLRPGFFADEEEKREDKKIESSAMEKPYRINVLVPFRKIVFPV